ncbi:flavodoxin family protein [Streptomyces sp. NBC_01233]|uniref:flavodoxin family protein n=1 Tax=Streptomyces sp. NBC_01233 TaxID=2903787 RepID=UPI002E0F7C9C|nr:flavodoxin family protein [Streptomyces sp. NBC_01233]
MTILGLSAGNPDGSAEILLKRALRAALERGADASLVRLDDLELPMRPVGPGQDAGADDGPWLWDRLMECDGLIVASPIYSRTIPGKLKLVADRLSGPAADVAFAEKMRATLAAGETPAVRFPYDERVFRPRVAAFIAVGGANTSQWKSLALPLMHQMTFSAHIAVADQLLVGGCGMPRSVVLDEDALVGADRVGRSVADQLGRAFDAVEYRGEPGLCPMCHLSMVVIDGTCVECATCGARGTLEVRDGAAVVCFDDPAAREHSLVTLAEKRAHAVEVQQTAAVQGAQAAKIERRAAPYAEIDLRVTPGTARPGRSRRS